MQTITEQQYNSLYDMAVDILPEHRLTALKDKLDAMPDKGDNIKAVLVLDAIREYIWTK